MPNADERRPHHSEADGSTLPKRSLRLSAPAAAQLIRDAMQAGGEMWVTGSGQSMHPTVRHADFVLIAPLGRDPRRGDVVLVPLGPRLMLHRVVNVEGDLLLTRGDARQWDDPPLSRADVVARAIAVRQTSDITPLILTMRFGVVSLVRFLLKESRRRAQVVRAYLATRSHK